MSGEMLFATDLYQGTASYYDRYRLPYPAELLTHLVAGAGVSGRGRLLDLACGTGQLAFALRPHFAEVWAVDQEPDMVEMVRAKAAAAGLAEVRAIVSSAETLETEPGSFELAVIGNAFHRLRRDTVAPRILDWLRPGGHLATCWSSSPWVGEQEWQRSLAAILDRWRRALGAEDRIPAGFDRERRERPDAEVFADAGFEAVETFTATVEHSWTLPKIAGHIRSTSFLSPAVLGDRAGAFDADLDATLRPFCVDGVLTETVAAAYELVRKPRS